MKKQAGFIHIILILVIMVVAIGGAYYFGTIKNKSGLESVVPTPTPSPAEAVAEEGTANWKTYPPSTTIGLSYTFKYPSTTVMEEAQDLVYFKTGNATIYHRFLGKQTDLVKAMDNFKPWGTNEVVGFSNEKKEVIYNILTGYKATSSDGNNTFLFLGSNELNGILVFHYPTIETKSGELLDQILSTFKFTK